MHRIVNVCFCERSHDEAKLRQKESPSESMGFKLMCPTEVQGSEETKAELVCLPTLFQFFAVVAILFPMNIEFESVSRFSFWNVVSP